MYLLYSGWPSRNEDGRIEAVVQKKNVQTYKEACHRLGVAPVQAVETSINSEHIQLGRYGLGPVGTKALAVALVVSIGQAYFTIVVFIPHIPVFWPNWCNFGDNVLKFCICCKFPPP